LAGDDPASESYVRQGQGLQAGWDGFRGASAAELHHPAEVEDIVRRLNDDPSVHGILVQHPIPKHLDETAVLALIRPEKDVDGISRSGLGALITGERPSSPARPWESSRCWTDIMFPSRAVAPWSQDGASSSASQLPFFSSIDMQP